MCVHHSTEDGDRVLECALENAHTVVGTDTNESEIVGVADVTSKGNLDSSNCDGVNSRHLARAQRPGGRDTWGKCDRYRLDR